MTTVLADAFLALLPTDHPWHDGHVPNGHDIPYRWVRVRLPVVTERSLARPGQLLVLDAVVTCVAGTAAGARGMAADTASALEGARPVAAGWLTSPVESLNAREVAEDTDVIIPGTNRHPIYTVTEWRFTASRTT